MSDYRKGVEDACMIVEMDENPVLDQFYCCSALDGPAQVCACQGVSIREEIVARIRALLDQPAPDTVTVPKAPTAEMINEIDALWTHIEDLVNDIERYIAIASEQAGRLVELEDALHWRLIETAPKDGSVVLGHADNCTFAMVWHPPGWFEGKPHSHASLSGGWVAQGYGCACSWGSFEGGLKVLSPNIVTPTHWRPLPPPPEITNER